VPWGSARDRGRSGTRLLDGARVRVLRLWGHAAGTTMIRAGCSVVPHHLCARRPLRARSRFDEGMGFGRLERGGACAPGTSVKFHSDALSPTLGPRFAGGVAGVAITDEPRGWRTAGCERVCETTVVVAGSWKRLGSERRSGAEVRLNCGVRTSGSNLSRELVDIERRRPHRPREKQGAPDTCQDPILLPLSVVATR
jgi:hypothetical protein